MKRKLSLHLTPSQGDPLPASASQPAESKAKKPKTVWDEQCSSSVIDFSDIKRAQTSDLLVSTNDKKLHFNAIFLSGVSDVSDGGGKIKTAKLECGSATANFVLNWLYRRPDDRDAWMQNQAQIFAEPGWDAAFDIFRAALKLQLPLAKDVLHFAAACPLPWPLAALQAAAVAAGDDYENLARDWLRRAGEVKNFARAAQRPGDAKQDGFLFTRGNAPDAAFWDACVAVGAGDGDPRALLYFVLPNAVNVPASYFNDLGRRFLDPDKRKNEALRDAVHEAPIVGAVGEFLKHFMTSAMYSATLR